MERKELEEKKDIDRITDTFMVDQVSNGSDQNDEDLTPMKKQQVIEGLF